MVVDLILLLVLAAIVAYLSTLLPAPASRIGQAVAVLVAVIALLNFVFVLLGHAPIFPVNVR